MRETRGNWRFYRLAVALAFTALVLFTALQTGQSGAAQPADGTGKARLIFVNGTRIAAINADGSDRRYLTHRSRSLDEYDEQFDRAPRVSPDGSRFLFLRDVDIDRGETTKLMVASIDGTGTRTVTTAERLAPKRKRHVPSVELKSAAWSADGEQIVFSQNDSRYWRFASQWSSRIRSIRPDGTGLRTLLTSKLDRSRGKGYRGPGLFTDIDISGTDGRILVTRERKPGGQADIVEFDPRSGALKRVVRMGKDGRWSPDGSSILFLSDRDRSGEQCYEGDCDFQVKLYTAGPDGSGQRRVQDGRQVGTIFGADWSPDGSRIAFGSDRNMPGIFGVSMEIYSIRPDGSCLTWLTNGAPESGDPNWSPASGPDSDPGACGAADREVVVDPLPSPRPRPRIGGKRTGWPRLWPGPVHQGKVLTLPELEGDNLAYFDCAYFQRSACPLTYTELESREVCARGLGDLLDTGHYRGMIRHRNAVVIRPVNNPDENRQVMLMTGGQLVTILLEDRFFRKPTTFAEYLGLIDELRPVGRDDLAGADLQQAVLTRPEVKRAAGIAKAFARSGSIPAVAKSHRLKRRAVRAYLRFERDLEKVGPFRTTGCR